MTSLMSERKELCLTASPSSAAKARTFLREQATLDSIRHAEAGLLVTELISNAIEHSPETPELVVDVSRSQRRLVVGVTHPRREPLDTRRRGIGFLLLERLAHSWDHYHDGEHLTVWFSLRTPGTIGLLAEISDTELFARMDEDQAVCVDELMRRHADLAASIARRYRGKGVDKDDLLQVANIGLLKAIQRYDPSIGNIRPYAAATISGELKRLLRDRGWSVKVPRSLQERSLEVVRISQMLAHQLNRPPDIHEIAAELDISEPEVQEAMDARNAYASTSLDSPEDNTGISILERLEKDDPALLTADDRVAVEQAIKELPQRQQRILDLRFSQDRTQAEIGREMGISQMHVSRLLASAFQDLAESLGTDTDRQEVS